MSQDRASENIASFHNILDSPDDNAVHHTQLDDSAGPSGFDQSSPMEVIATAHDITDGCFTDIGFKIIKGVIATLLQHIVNVKLKEECLGCEIDHPSQRQHSCLYEPSAYYFSLHFVEFTRRLFKPALHTVVTHALQCRGFKADPLTIQGAAGAILHELKAEPYIVSKLHEIQDGILDGDSDKLCYDVINYWHTYADVSKV